MYLKQIIAQGFKSFADKINIDLEKGITGVVGPNGSGKSNIVDAVRWVLGEQSVKSLRGDGSMTDVIFSGSKTRNPSNSASVTLIFDNSDNHLKIEYKEVAIKRTVYRNGENEYFLNNQKCRLKDILDLFIDSGAGRESFNIISQGDIANILSSKPEERRTIFESAAGVLKYKRRKEDALRKLERTHNNIDRVNDIMNELESQINPLKEQSENAKKYLKTKEELENIEVSLIAYDIEKLNSEYEDNKKKKEELNKEIFDIETSLNIENSKLDEKKLSHSELNDKKETLNRELIEQVTLVEKLNSEKTIITERKKYAVEDTKLHSNLIDLKEQKLGLENKIESINKDIEIININLKELDIDNCINELNELKSSKDKIINELNTRYKDKTNLEYKIKVIKDNIENNSDLYFSVKSVLNNKSLKGIYGVIGKLISFEEKYSTAIDISLSSSSQFIVCEDEYCAKEAINYLKINNLGRATFLPLSVIDARVVDEYTYNTIKDEDGFIDIASNLVTFDLKYSKAILNQLGNIIVVKDIDNANRISNKINHKYRIVTLDGELLHVGGSITGGTIKKSSNVILDKIELEKSTKQLDNINSTIKTLEIKLSNIDSSIKNIEEKYNKLNSNKVSLEQILSIKEDTLLDYKNKLSSINNDLNSIENMLNDTLTNEEDNIMKSYFEALSKKEIISKDISILNTKIDAMQNEINELEHNIKITTSKLNKNKNMLNEIELSQTRIEVKLDSLLQTLNEEYNMTFEKAKRDYVLILDYEEAKTRVSELRDIIRDLGMVNLAAIEEYERISNRYEFLNNQKTDLYKAENTLNSIIKEMDIVMKENFTVTFKKIQEEFVNVFKELFGGGYAELKLTDPNNILETGIDIVALPPGKKLQHISLLSGGEKALTAISLLFAVLKVRPVPFCLLDEVEAPLDDVNVDNFGKFLKQYENKTQFIVITHKKKTMEYADVLYGITMQESGVSKLVSVRLKDI